MSAPWDLVGTPLHRLHKLHRDAMAAYSLEAREESLFGGQCPREVVLNGRYVSLDVGGGEDDGGEKAGDSERLQDAIIAALSQKRAPAAVVKVVGGAGAGKSTALQKLLADWASGTRLPQFAFAFPLALGELGSGSGELSLTDLLSRQHPHLSDASLPLVFQNPQAVLFVLDGLDQNHSQQGAAPPSADPNQPVPLSALVSGLVQGILLPTASVLVTSRPTPALKLFSHSERMEVRGISRAGRRAYVRLFFPDPERAAQVLEHMEETMGFYDLARSPGFCWTLCSVYRAALAAGRGLPQTLTGVFGDAVASLIQGQAMGEEPAGAMLSGLGKMAAGAVLNGGGPCSREEMSGFGLLPFLTSPALQEILRTCGPADTPQRSSFSFRLPALAQFLLAVAYHRGCWDTGDLADLLKLADGKADLLELFLAGLCDPSQRAPLEGAVGKFDAGCAREFIAWLQETTQEAVQSYHKLRHLRCFRLLHQRQDPALVRAAIGPSSRLGLSYGGLSVQDCVALSYVMTCGGDLEQLNLYNSNRVSEEQLLRLRPAISVANKIILSQSGLSAGSCASLAEGIRGGTVRELDLSYSRSVGDSGAQSLCAGLQGSSLRILRIPCCGLTEEGCGYLATALRASQLHLLDVRGNDIKDAGLVQLSQALSSPQCRLQELGVQMCKLTGASMEALSSALRCGHSALRSLDLTNNELGDSGMKHISQALQDPNCHLERLLVATCDLTEVCCAGLADALRAAGGALTELDLSINDLEDTGLLQLCHAFKTAACAPHKLRLARCEIGVQTFEELAAVLRCDGSQLRELEVGVNQVGDAGVQHLWDALRDPVCKLEHLDVEMVGMTDGCVADLCAAVKNSRFLKSLVLKNNEMTDSAVPALVAMAKDSRTLRELNLQYNDFSEDAFELMDDCGKIKY